MLNKNQRIVCAIGALFFLFIGLAYLSEEKRIFTGIISLVIGFVALLGSLSGGNTWVDLKNWLIGCLKNKFILWPSILLVVAAVIYGYFNSLRIEKNNARTFNTEEGYTPSPRVGMSKFGTGNKFKTGRFRNLFKSKF